MIIYPAIDIRGGRCVRLLEGRADTITDYGDPARAAGRWRKQGAQWLHVVDLDGAFTGRADNLEAVRRIAGAADVPVQLGGGIRSMEDIAYRLEKCGVRRAILGTVAAEDPELVRVACAAYPGRIACGIDARDGWVMVRGWVEAASLSAAELALRMREAGVMDIIYTDIARDGKLEGPNIEAMSAMIEATGMRVIASGGVATLDDIDALKAAGCAGAVCGKALYAGAFSLADAVARAE